MNQLKNIFGQNAHWQVNKHLARMIGIEATILLADLFDKSIYFDNRGELEDEFFFNTRENIEKDTTLSPHKQRMALDILRKYNLIETKEKGVPRRTFYKVNKIQLLKILTTGGEKIERQDVKNFDINKNKVITIKKENKEIPSETSSQDKEQSTKTLFEEDKSGQSSKDVSIIIKEMEVIDKKNKTYYGNKTQRLACEFLLEEYGKEEVLNAIKYYKKMYTEGVQYLPSISSPYDLKEKWTKLVGLVRRIEIEKNEVRYKVAF